MRTSRISIAHVNGRLVRPVSAAVMLAVALTMAACAVSPAASAPTHRPTAEATITPMPKPSSPQRTDSPAWSPPITMSGTGPQTVTVTVPSPQYGHINSSFACTVGAYTVTLVELPGVFESGQCGGQPDVSNDSAANYEMPLPVGAQTLHFSIQVSTDSGYKFSGSFIQ